MFLFAASLIVLVPVIGLAVDVSLMNLAQAKLFAAVDAAALAGARALSRGADDAAQQLAATSTATSYFLKNFPAGYLSTTNVPNPTVAVTTSANLRTVTVNTTVQFPLTFLRWLGPSMGTSPINALAAATRRDVNVMLVLDHSGSLHDSGSCEPMKAAAITFLSHFAQGRDNVGLVTFATGSAVDVPLNSTFASGATDVAAVISMIGCASSTNSSSGLWRAYRQLAALNQPGALNAILFFTDGMPTSFTAWNNVTNTSCSAFGWTAGVIGSQGLGDPNQTATQSESLLPATGCSWSSGWNTADVPEVHKTDYWGNSIDGTYAPVTVTDPTLPANSGNMQNASVNATISAAQRIRTGQPDLIWTGPTTNNGAGHLFPVSRFSASAWETPARRPTPIF